MELSKKIGTCIKNGIMKKNISQQNLAKIMKVDKSTVSHWINGRAIPPGGKLLYLIELLDIIPELFPWYGQVESEKPVREEMKQVWQSIHSLNQKMEFLAAGKTLPPTHSFAGPISKRKLHIVVIEDDCLLTEVVEKFLGSKFPSFEIQIFSTGEEAMSFLEAKGNKTSLILLDLRLPKMSGLEVLKKLASDDILRKIPVFLMTAQQEAIVETLKYGIIGMLEKPFKLGKLAEELHKLDLDWPLKKRLDVS